MSYYTPPAVLSALGLTTYEPAAGSGAFLINPPFAMTEPPPNPLCCTVYADRTIGLTITAWPCPVRSGSWLVRFRRRESRRNLLNQVADWHPVSGWDRHLWPSGSALLIPPAALTAVEAWLVERAAVEVVELQWPASVARGCYEAAAEAESGSSLQQLLVAAGDLLERGHPAASPAPLPLDYIDPEHQGDDRELLETFYGACKAEGGTADEIYLRGIRAVLAARPAAPPAPEAKAGELGELVDRLGWIAAQLGDIGWSDDSASVARAATLLQSLSAPAPAAVPVSVAERLPGEGDCDEEGQCWLTTTRTNPGWVLDCPERCTGWTHWVPAGAISAVASVGRLEVVPVALAERLPGEEDCAPWPDEPEAIPWCWAGKYIDGWEWMQRSMLGLKKGLPTPWFSGGGWTHWLPFHAIPLPQGGEGEA